MRKSLYILLLAFLLTNVAFSQEETVYSVYFDVNKYNLDDKQGNNVVAFIVE